RHQRHLKRTTCCSSLAYSPGSRRRETCTQTSKNSVAGGRSQLARDCGLLVGSLLRIYCFGALPRRRYLASRRSRGQGKLILSSRCLPRLVVVDILDSPVFSDYIVFACIINHNCN